MEHGNRYPDTNLAGIRRLVVEGGYIEETRWHHEVDAWNNALAYHAAPDGSAYIILSPGSDGKWDAPLETYFTNTEQGNEIYGGPSNDPSKDLIWATGSFVQVYSQP